VKQRVGTIAWLASPLKAWSPRFTLALLLVFAVAMLALSASNPTIATWARTAAGDAVAPLLDLLSRPAATTAEAIGGFRDLANLRAENARLREEHQRLLQWQAVARRLDAENQQLRQLLNLAPDPRARFLTARVVSVSGGAFVRSVLIAAGERDGVRKNQAVLSGEGLVGRVSEVGERSARVLLMTDINSRIPVFVERTRERAVLAGDNSDRLRLLYLPEEQAATVGDRIITSGHGGVFPPGLPIGDILTAVEGTAEVQPYVEWDRLEYVRLVDYELAGLLLPNAGQGQPKGPR
jgi:rod shape-determining protein MreC